MFPTHPTKEYLEALVRNVVELNGSDAREAKQASKAGDVGLEQKMRDVVYLAFVVEGNVELDCLVPALVVSPRIMLAEAMLTIPCPSRA
jgi:hypothetical protein